MSSQCPTKPNVHCDSCESRSTNNIFCNLPPEALVILDKNKSLNTYKRGQYLFYAGNTPSGLYCINAGVIKLESDTKDGSSHLHRVLSKGDILGYRSLFSEEDYSCSAVVHEDAVVCFIPKASILELLRTFPDVGLKFLFYVSKELGAAESRNRSLAEKEAPKRVAETIIHFKHAFPDSTWTRKDLAEWANTTPETVMRSLSDFKDRGFIDLVGRKIEFKDYDALLKFSDPSA